MRKKGPMGNSDGMRKRDKIVLILGGRGRWEIPAVREGGVI